MRVKITIKRGSSTSNDDSIRASYRYSWEKDYWQEVHVYGDEILLDLPKGATIDIQTEELKM
jgi:hypothetical protein